MNVILVFLSLVFIVSGCSRSSRSIDEIMNDLNKYKIDGTKKALNNAEVLLESGLKLYPSEKKLIKEIIVVNLHQGDWVEMEKYVKRGMAIDANNEDFIFYRIKLLFGTDRHEELIRESRYYLKNIQSKLIKANIQHLLGSVYESLNNQEAAETSYLKALELYKSGEEENVIIYNDIGSFYAKNGDLDLAQEYFGKSLEINANNYQVVNNMGNIFYNKGDIKKSLHFFERSLILNSNQPGLSEAVEKMKKEMSEEQNVAQ